MTNRNSKLTIMEVHLDFRHIVVREIHRESFYVTVGENKRKYYWQP